MSEVFLSANLSPDEKDLRGFSEEESLGEGCSRSTRTVYYSVVAGAGVVEAKSARGTLTLRTSHYRDTSLIRINPFLGPHSRTMSRAMWRPWGGGGLS